MVRVGLIVRSNDRGLGTQTREAYYGYPFDSVLHVLDHNPTWPERPDAYPGAHIAHWVDGRFKDEEIIPFLDEIDVVFSVETLYDWQFVKLADKRGVRTIVQGNPEFYRHAGILAGQPEPDEWVWPTPWMVDQLPSQTVIPVPVAVDCTAKPGGIDDRLVVVHVAGHRAAGDRNGTEVMMQAIPIIRSEVTVRIVGQDGPETVLRGRIPRLRDNVTLEVNEAGVDDRWSMYDGAHVLVLPRRYGGLSLPAQEGFQAGLAVMMTNCEPNNIWPIHPLYAKPGRAQLTPFGYIPTWAVPPVMIAKRIDEMNRNREILALARERAKQWAEANSWERLQPVYDRLFGKT